MKACEASFHRRVAFPDPHSRRQQCILDFFVDPSVSSEDLVQDKDFPCSKLNAFLRNSYMRDLRGTHALPVRPITSMDRLFYMYFLGSDCNHNANANAKFTVPAPLERQPKVAWEIVQVCEWNSVKSLR